jgi:NAD(P)-dependent dehydrogenase (short-subunit alcohol dehydrogenase family)
MMNGKRVCVTGGNSGIGKATAAELARQGAEVIIATRNQERGEQAAAEIRKQTGNKQVYFRPLDLSDLSNVQSAGEQFNKELDRLDVLINNAGLIKGRFVLTADGFESQIGVNHFGHFYFTHLLLPLLRRSDDPRVITVSSGAHTMGKIDWSSFRTPSRSYSIMGAYAQSKLANILFSKELARRHSDISSYALFPGAIRTPFGNKQESRLFAAIWKLMKPFQKSPEVGAQTSIYLAVTPELHVPNGQYFGRSKPQTPSKLAQNDQLAQELWERTEALLTEAGFPVGS